MWLIHLWKAGSIQRVPNDVVNKRMVLRARPMLRFQHTAWRPRLSMMGMLRLGKSQSELPRRRPTVMRSTLSFYCKPQVVIGRTCNRSPMCSQVAASNLALCSWSEYSSSVTPVPLESWAWKRRHKSRSYVAFGIVIRMVQICAEDMVLKVSCTRS